MSNLSAMDPAQLQQLTQQLEQRYRDFQAQGLSLDMTRGKPAPEQLDLSNTMLTLPGEAGYRDTAGTDCRNYGGLDGLPAMKALFADILQADAHQVIVGGNASLTMMYDALVRAYLFGVPGGERPWKDEGQIKFLCPVPGYDRHFAITEALGFEMIPVPMTASGPDMDQVEALVKGDASVKGIWCVPKYSNPTGVTFSDEVVDRLASMPTAAGDFRIMWDNAYAEHTLTGRVDPLKPILAACDMAGHPDRVLMFGSTSKMSFAGSGVAAMAASDANIADAKARMGIQSIGPDKINQLRQLALFSTIDELRAHMQQHAAILAPKFQRVDAVLQEELGDADWAVWSQPTGGYFINLDTQPSCAGQVVAMAAAAGVKLTAAGASFPLGNDPRDCNIRIAPSMPAIDDIETAIRVLSTCIKLVTLQQLQR